ncbi:hypothetical protein ACGFNU_21105 [Spirillospora sp. NPDC048911]|uniref:hypothetical protein n=1 Tax=Spirillospora sp. NPDC048911 TaxID=3364527 RepID=UPI003720DD02
MTSPVPAQPPAAPAGGSGYTHRTWRDEMGEILLHVAGIYRDLEEMHYSLRRVEAGRTQLTRVAGAITGGHDLMVRGVTYVKSADDRYLPVHEAIKRAGGATEVAQDKRYHDRD